MGENHPREAHKALLVQEAAAIFKVDLSKCVYVFEQVFAIKFNDKTSLATFFLTWDRLAKHFQLKGWHEGEGHTIAVAAGYSNIPIKTDYFLGKGSVFKDKNCYVDSLKEEDISLATDICIRQHELISSLGEPGTISGFLQRVQYSFKRRLYSRFHPPGWRLLNAEETGPLG